MDAVLNALRAAGEHSRLRLLALLARDELTVSELTQITRQSQPRVSRHLKLLCEAGLLDRSPEGAWVFHRVAERGVAAQLAAALIALLPHDDPELAHDRERLEAVKADRARAAAGYFRKVAGDWDRIRSLYVAESDVEAAMLEMVGPEPIDSLLDVGTGTGRILQVFGKHIERGLGIDLSREMLGVARANLAERGLGHCRVRQGDIYDLSALADSMSVVTIHHVLHFLDDPGAAIAEAARTLFPGGRLVIVDFAPHRHEFLRGEYAHRRLGFGDGEVSAWCRAAGIEHIDIRHLAPGAGGEASLTVTAWTGVRGDTEAHPYQEVA